MGDVIFCQDPCMKLEEFEIFKVNSLWNLLIFKFSHCQWPFLFVACIDSTNFSIVLVEGLPQCGFFSVVSWLGLKGWCQKFIWLQPSKFNYLNSFCRLNVPFSRYILWALERYTLKSIKSGTVLFLAGPFSDRPHTYNSLVLSVMLHQFLIKFFYFKFYMHFFL